MPTEARKFAGADWLIDVLASHGSPAPSALGVDVAEVLGNAFSGIYHIPSQALFHERTKWHDERYIEFVTGRSLSTYDFSELSDLVFGCIQRKIRLEVYGAARGYLKLTFMREPDPKRAFERCPDAATFVAKLMERTAP